MDAATTRSLRRRIRDLHALECHVLEALGHQRMLEPRSSEVGEAIRIVHEAVDRSVVRIAARLGELPCEDGRLAESMAGVVGTAIGLVDRLRGTSVARAVHDDRVALERVAVGYEMLLTTALATGDVPTAHLAELALRDYARCVRQLDDVLAMATMDDLQADPDVTVVNAGVANAVRAAVGRARRPA